MSIAKWNQRYRAGEQIFEVPSPLVLQFTADLAPGTALDLACGPGRNALFLAERGWKVTAVDGSPVAIELLRACAHARSQRIETQIADLERGEFEIAAGAYDLICACYYLQRDLIPAIQRGVRPGGLAVVIVHLADPVQPHASPSRAVAGELRKFFADWTILHYYEGQPHESCHLHGVAELVGRKPDIS